jgi:hypothetical protein
VGSFSALARHERQRAVVFPPPLSAYSPRWSPPTRRQKLEADPKPWFYGHLSPLARSQITWGSAPAPQALLECGAIRYTRCAARRRNPLHCRLRGLCGRGHWHQDTGTVCCNPTYGVSADREGLRVQMWHLTERKKTQDYYAALEALQASKK